MIVYHLDFEESGKFFRYYSDQFPTVSGYGESKQEAALDFYKKQNDELNRLIRNGERLPKPLSLEEILKRSQEGSFKGIYKNPTVCLAMYLHTAMLEKEVSRVKLANLLALDTEVEDDEWQLENTKHIKPRKPPQHKKVQRLLDVNHHSTIREVSEAFRVIDYNVDFVVRPKNTVDWEPVLEI